MKKIIPVVLFVGFGVGGLLGFWLTNILKHEDPRKNQTLLGENAVTGSCSSGGNTTNEGALVQFDGKDYTREDLPKDMKNILYEIENEGHQKSLGYYQEFVVRLALAKEKGLNSDPLNLPPINQLLSPAEITEEKLKQVYEQNKNQIPGNPSFESVKAQIKQYVQGQELNMAFFNEVKKLESSGRMKILAKAPIPPEIEIETEGFPSKGPADATHTLIEISDYTCGHCQKVHPEVKSLLEEMGNKLKFVQINFSLRPDSLSGALARGAFCANEQGQDKFWAFHDNAFKADPPHDHNAHKDGHHSHETTPAEDKNKAKEVAKLSQLDVSKFEKCLDGPTAKEFVEKTNTKLSSLGINSTPTFFLNKKKIVLGPKGLKDAVTVGLNEKLN